MEQMTAQEALEAAKGITFEKAWAIMQNNWAKWEEEQRKLYKQREAMWAAEEKKRAAEEKRREEQRAAEEKRREEQRAAEEKRRAAEEKKREEQRAAEMAEFKKNLEKAVGNLGNTIGDLSESLFSGSIHTKFEKYGYEFIASNPDKVFYDKKRAIAEADIWLENGDYVMAIEVKTKPVNSDIDKHIERLDKIRAIMDKSGNKRVLLGAIACGIVNKQVIRYAHSKGLYIVVQSGESVEVADPPEGFKAREW